MRSWEFYSFSFWWQPLGILHEFVTHGVCTGFSYELTKYQWNWFPQNSASSTPMWKRTRVGGRPHHICGWRQSPKEVLEFLKCGSHRVVDDRAWLIFNNFWEYLDPDGYIPIKSVIALANMNLGIISIRNESNFRVVSWANYREVMSERAKSQPHLFLKQHWRIDKIEALRSYVYEQFREEASQYSWNKSDKVCFRIAHHQHFRLQSCFVLTVLRST